MRFHEDTLELDEACVHDYSVACIEFVNFLSPVIGSRLPRCFNEAHLLEMDTHMGILRKLAKARVACCDGNWGSLSRFPRTKVCSGREVHDA